MHVVFAGPPVRPCVRSRTFRLLCLGRLSPNAVRSLLGSRERLVMMKQRAAEAGQKYRRDPLLSQWRADLSRTFAPELVGSGP